MNIRDLLEKNRETVQLAYGVVLLILIPLLIAFNTVFIIGKYNQSIDFILRKQALSIGQTISTLMKGDLPWEYFIQVKLDSLLAENSDIQELTVLRPEGDDFKVIASTDSELTDKVMKSFFYKYAWLQPEGGGLATDSYQLVQSGQEPELVNDQVKKERFWLVAVPMKDASDKKQALLAIKLSSEIVDELTAYTRNASIYLLLGTMFVVILFLLVVVRLWDYALLYKKTKEIDKMKDEFISMASHELRAPVTGIRGFTSMILSGEMGEINDKIRKALKLTLNASERLTVLVDDLLDVGRIEQGRMSIKLEPTDVVPLIKETIEEFSIEAKKKKLTINFKPHQESLPDIKIDHDRFKQIFVNLISNAVKYTESGGIEITTRNKYDGRALEIVIKDTGIGMSSDDRKRLFEKFYRVKNDQTANVTGTGLGLWITRQLVGLMHGTITIDSIENVGTQVTLQFTAANKNKKV